MNTSLLRPVALLSACWLSVLLAAGCAMVPVPTRSPHAGEAGPLGECAQLFASLDAEAREAGVMDAGAFRVKGHPYLRADRFLASFGNDELREAGFTEWVNRMREMDRDARRHEVANLPPESGLWLQRSAAAGDIHLRIAECGKLLQDADLCDAQGRENLRQSVLAPDEYIEARRVLGLYPVVRWFVAAGVDRWQQEAKAAFSTLPPAGWKALRYGPETPSGDLFAGSGRAGSAARGALGIPDDSPEEKEDLLRRHAPVWEVETAGVDDRVGSPFWGREGDVAVDTEKPAVFTRVSFTRFGFDILTQLNYVIWFPSRPAKGALDIYAGALDGVNYRVTLDRDGKPLLFEIVHNCGCYYQAHPSPRLRVKESPTYSEPPLILPAPRVDPESGFVVVALESRTHHVRHLYGLSRRDPGKRVPLPMEDYGRLLSLPAAGAGSRGMFGQDGRVAGSERLERFLLWPTGVFSPGAMRRWGRHAVAFAGKRHFDDPFFMDAMFVRAD